NGNNVISFTEQSLRNIITTRRILVVGASHLLIIDIGNVNIEQCSQHAQPNRQKIASVTWDQVRAIAEDKMPDLNCFTVESAMKLVAGTARSMGITVTGDFPG
ncbi:MAG: hypothetical protein IJM84_06945, partial [Bacteroidaceae bacterium]|nr:hypothetical protein [Bacteroidaceae bacterium]